MYKLTHLINNGGHDVYLDGVITTTTESKITIRNVAIYWDFKNVLKAVNDTINVVSGSTITFGEGYWTFDMIRNLLSEENIKLECNIHDNTCKIHSTKQLNLLYFGPLLGFPVNQVVQANTWTNSPSHVDVNLGLRYVTIECGCANTDRNFDEEGNKSGVIATIPVSSEQRLNSTVTFYDDINTTTPIQNGDHNVFKYRVSTNIGDKVDLTVMFEMYIS